MTLIIAYLILGSSYPSAGFMEHAALFVFWLARVAWYNPSR